MPRGAAATVAILALPVRDRMRAPRGGKSQIAIFIFGFTFLLFKLFNRIVVCETLVQAILFV